MTRKLRIGVMFGGRSGEHEVSLNSATAVIDALDQDKYEIVPIGITKSGRWFIADDALRILKDGQGDTVEGRVYIPADPRERSLSGIASTASRQRRYKLDVVIPILHGTFGEDGTVQGLLELTDIPYVGAGVLASATGMDKIVMKQLFRYHGIPVLDFRSYRRQEWHQTPDEVVQSIEKEIGYPCYTKPAGLGSSVGIRKVHDRNELPAALDEAAKFDRRIIVEVGLEGYREIECSVLGNDEPMASIPGEIVLGSEFYDYTTKYVHDTAQLMIPAELPETTVQEIQRLSIQSFQVIDCCGMARVDFFISPDGREVIVNEINTLPGFTGISMYPRLWAASGLNMTALLDRLIELALERHADKAASQTSYGN